MTPFYEQVLAKTLPEGMYAFTATVELASLPYQSDGSFYGRCELRDGTTVLGGAGAKQSVEGNYGQPIETLALTGTRLVPASGTEISIWCKIEGAPEGRMFGAQLLTLKIAGSF